MCYNSKVTLICPSIYYWVNTDLEGGLSLSREDV